MRSELVDDAGQNLRELAAAVTLAACLEPKMADTILPKMLIFSSSRSPLQSKHRLSAVPSPE
jgi:hypothetical protein